MEDRIVRLVDEIKEQIANMQQIKNTVTMAFEELNRE